MTRRIIRLGADALAGQSISRSSVWGERSDAPVAGSTKALRVLVAAVINAERCRCD